MIEKRERRGEERRGEERRAGNVEREERPEKWDCKPPCHAGYANRKT